MITNNFAEMDERRHAGEDVDGMHVASIPFLPGPLNQGGGLEWRMFMRGEHDVRVRLYRNGSFFPITRVKNRYGCEMEYVGAALQTEHGPDKCRVAVAKLNASGDFVCEESLARVMLQQIIVFRNYDVTTPTLGISSVFPTAKCLQPGAPVE